MSASGAKTDDVVFNMVHLDGKGENDSSDRYTSLKDYYTHPLITITYRIFASKHGIEEAVQRGEYEEEPQKGKCPDIYFLIVSKANNMIY